MLWQPLLITRYKWAVRHVWDAVISSKFCICPDKGELVEIQPSYFCGHQVLHVHFPFSEKAVITSRLFTVGLCWRCSVDKYFPLNKRRMRHLSYPTGVPANTERIYPPPPLEISLYSKDIQLILWRAIVQEMAFALVVYLLADAVASMIQTVAGPRGLADTDPRSVVKWSVTVQSFPSPMIQCMCYLK